MDKKDLYLNSEPIDENTSKNEFSMIDETTDYGKGISSKMKDTAFKIYG